MSFLKKYVSCSLLVTNSTVPNAICAWKFCRPICCSSCAEACWELIHELFEAITMENNKTGIIFENGIAVVWPF